MTANICKVLLIDDDEDDYIVTRDFLDEAEQLSFQLNWVDNYDDGLIEIGKNQHDLYLLDFRLGKGNGLELLEEAIAKGCNKPIILLTGLGDSEIDQRAMKSGASDYLVKGRFLSATLLERSIIHAIERKHSENRQLQLVGELAAVNQELKDFAYIVSHDLKAPLRGIASLADWLQKDYGDRLDDEGRDMLQLMSSRVRRMSDLIDGVLQYSRVGRVREDKNIIDLQALVHNTIDAIAPPSGIKIEIDTNLPTLLAEKHRMHQVFQKLQQAIADLQQENQERLKIEDSLRESQKRFESLAAVAPVGIYRTNTTGDCIYVNDRWCEIAGLTAAEAFGPNWARALHPEDREKVGAEWYASVQENRPFELECRFQKPDGTVTWVLSRANAEHDIYGEIIGYVGTITDISDRKRAETVSQKLVTGTAAVTGADFFVELVRHIAEALDIAYALVTEVVDEQLVSLGFWANGSLQPSISYLPAKTPCEICMQEGQYHCEESVQAAFAEDLDLVTMQAESYLGIALKDDDGNVIGNLCVLDTKPMSETKRAEAIGILQVFAARASAELQRKNVNEELNRLNHELEERVLERTQALQEREEQLRDFFDNATDLIQSISPEGNILFVNRAWKSTLGYSEAELENISIFQIIHPEDLEHCQLAMQNLFSGDQCVAIETRFVTKDGQTIVVEGNVNCQLKDGVPIATRGIFRDVTERKKVENELLESKQFLQLVLDTFPLFVFWKDHQSVYLGCNQNFAVSVGLNLPSEIVGKTDYEMPWGNTEAYSYRSDDRQVITSGKPKLNIIETQYQENGETIWLETNKVPLRNLHGEIIGILGTYQDISDRKRAEETLAESEAFNRQLVEEFPIGLVSCRLDGHLVFVNTVFAQILGRTVEEILSLSYWDITPTKYAEQEAEQLRLIQTEGRYGPYEKEYIHKDGHLVPVMLSGLMILRNGELLIWSSVQDISDRKQAEAQLQLANEELMRATRLKDEFLANMSHELRTPLNSILGMTEILQEQIFGSINDQQLGALKTVENSSTHLLSLINDILDVSKIESGQVDLDLTATSIESLCKSSLAFIKQQALTKRIQLSLRVPQNLSEIMLDERRIRQVLINLLNNAVKFTLEGGTITLEVTRIKLDGGETKLTSPNYLRIAVIDTGIGISAENIKKLFQPFIQIDSALNRQYNGTGLGLALVKRIVELHGGSVELTSELGVGSCFAITLPFNVENPNLEVQIQYDLAEISLIDQSQTNNLSSPLILLAEDNEANINTFSSYLQAKGYRLVFATDGQQAIAITKAEHPDLILMDIQMPVIDGLEAIKQIRLDPDLADIPIIALTALAMAGDRERCLDAGANEYLQKPLKLKQLATSIQQILNAKKNL